MIPLSIHPHRALHRIAHRAEALHKDHPPIAALAAGERRSSPSGAVAVHRAVPICLSPGEAIQGIIGTDRRVFVYKKGFVAGASFGAEITSWDYQGVVGVQIHTGMMSGAVVVQAPGQSGVRTSAWKSGDEDPYKAPNAIPINRPWEQAQAGVARLRQLIEEAGQHVQAARPAPRTGVSRHLTRPIATWPQPAEGPSAQLLPRAEDEPGQ